MANGCVAMWFWRAIAVMVVVAHLYVAYAIVLDGDVVNKPIIHWAGSCAVMNEEPLHPGDDVIGRMSLTKGVNLPGEINWTLVSLSGGLVYKFAPRKAFTPVGYHDFQAVMFTLPDNLPPGNYRGEGFVEYAVNPIKNVRVRVKTQPFRVAAQ